MSAVRRVTDACEIVLFLLAITVSMAGSVLGRRARVADQENRALAPRPLLRLEGETLAEFPGRFEAYYADRFGFRGTLLRWNNLVRARWLGTSPTPKVVIGQSGWLYMADENAMEDYVAARPFSVAALAEWQDALEARNWWLARQGVHFLVMFAPNAQTIYPEYLPASVRRLGSASRLDQLIGRLRVHSTLPVVDVRDDLRLAKARERVYHRTGSHWNERGAFVAYSRIVTALRQWYPDLSPLPRDDFEDVVEDRPGDDLARMMGLRDILREECLLLRPRVPRRARRAEAGFRMPGLPPWWQPRALETGDDRLPRAVVLRDSFTTALVPFLSEHFARVIYLFTEDMDPAIIEREHPGVVIEEFVERRLMRQPLVNRPELAAEWNAGAALMHPR